MNFFGHRLLFVGAHPDDIEIGCGAFLASISSDAEVLCVTLSENREKREHQHLVEEHHRSMAVLGVAAERTIIAGFETRNFPRDRQAILEYLYELNRTHQPDIIFVHSQADIHQDHAVVTMEALRAFRGTTVLGFDVLRSSYSFFPNFLVEVSEGDVEKKILALSKYETYSDKYYFDREIVRATLIRHGALAERPFAEGFDILRIVGIYLGTSFKGD